MRANITESVVGAIVLFTAALFIFFAAQFTDKNNSQGYDLTANFRSAQGINIGTDVRMVGVKIGTVSDMALDTELFRAKVQLTIQNDIPIPNDSIVAVASEGFLGGNFIEITPGASFENYTAGDEIIDTQGSVSLIDLLLKFVSGSGDGG